MNRTAMDLWVGIFVAVGLVAIVFLALKHRMILDLEHHIKISRRTAVRPRLPFILKPQACAVVHTRRNVDLQLALGPLVALTLAFLAGPPDDLPAAIALRACAPDGQEALLEHDFAASTAQWTGDQSVFGLRALASFTLWVLRHQVWGPRQHIERS